MERNEKGMSKEFKRKMEIEYISTWENLKYYIKIGKAKEFFGKNPSMEVQVEGFGMVVFDVLDYDKEEIAEAGKKHSVTLAVRDLIFDSMPFKNECHEWEEYNKWGESDIRKYINSKAFISRFESNFRELLCKVYKDNGTEEKKTIDTFFLLSENELNGRYEFFKNEKSRIKVNSKGETGWYWTRTAAIDSAYTVRVVWPTGTYYYADASRDFCCLPACVIAA